MKKAGNQKVILLFSLAAGFLSCALVTVFLTYYFNHRQYTVLGNLCSSLVERYPDSRQEIPEILKEQNLLAPVAEAENVLISYGYREEYFQGETAVIFLIAAGSFILSGILIFVAYLLRNRKIRTGIAQLTGYLEKVNTGSQGILMDTEETMFSGLQDEIYKTITTLNQTKEAALLAKNNYADNLSNIAHQLKTPITAISLSAQMLKEIPASISSQTQKEIPVSTYGVQIERQLGRLTHLEEALLVLSRIDAGTLQMKRKTVDVFTLLTLAADNLQELSEQAGIHIEIPEAAGIEASLDLDWTMEAVMNLMKNCMEHSPQGGTVHCSYEKNPLYTQIQIRDEGSGFEKEDIYHLFERFYRGKNATAHGIGIGLALAKEIIEMQNGIISAFNLPDGGACFELRIYDK